MWTTIYVATGHNWANKVQDSLKDEGFLVKQKEFSTGDVDDLYEILVLEYEAKDAQQALVELGIL